jgi:hypothetical protein
MSMVTKTDYGLAVNGIFVLTGVFWSKQGAIGVLTCRLVAGDIPEQQGRDFSVVLNLDHASLALGLVFERRLLW